MKFMYRKSDILLKIINFIYSVDKMLRVIRIIDWTLILKFCVSLLQFRLIKRSIFVHSTMRNAPYVHLRLDSILELCLVLQQTHHIVTHTGPHKVTSSNIHQIRAKSLPNQQMHDGTSVCQGVNFYESLKMGTHTNK